MAKKTNKSVADVSNCIVINRLEDGKTVDKIKVPNGSIIPFSFKMAHIKKNLNKRLFAVDEEIAKILEQKF